MTKTSDRHKVKTISARVDEKLYQAFIDKCEEEGTNKNQLLNKMIESYLFSK